jgi:RNA-directed DNA polymerase
MSELLEKILSRNNMNEAYKRVKTKNGAGGVDDMEIEDLPEYIRENWDSIKEQIRERKYKPQPVRRAEIPKPDGSKRKLGIPTVMDRVIQQAIAQVISPMCEPLFSENSYGFRPNRSCEMGIKELLKFLNEGYEWIVDIDLEKFFDNVPQEKLMSLVHNIINDGDTESLIRKYLKAGVMVQGKYEKTDKGTPQGGNLSPLLSNIMLNELDKELEKRGLHFVRYADDCVIAVRSEASAKRVMYSITNWIERKLGLKVNATKTKITRPMKLKYLGFGFYKDSKAKDWKYRPNTDSVNKFKRKLKNLTIRKYSINFRERIK